MPRGYHIAVDALAARFGGTAYLAVELSRALARHRDVDRVTTIARRGSIVERELRERGDLHVARLPAHRRVELVRRIGWQAARLPAFLARLRADGLVTFSGMLPVRVPCAVVSHLSNPVMYEQRTPANALRRWAVRTTVARGSAMLVPSMAMADLVAADVGRRPRVVPHGIDHEMFRPSPNSGTEVLSVADPYPHKRLDLVLEAWARLPSPRPPLRFIGNPAVSPATWEALRDRAAQVRGGDVVTFESGLSLAALADTYRRARVMCVASEHESFCLPVSEAIASGVPVLINDLPALRETGGPGTITVTPPTPERWGAALAALLDDDGEHERRRAAGLAHATRYTWDAVADGVMEKVTCP